jgi:8-oxo-dGTP pyrophosphatase MutT (NUDIX family)
MIAHYLKKELEKLFKKPKTNKKVIKRSLKRLASGSKIIKDHGTTDHFCAFFLPVNRNNKTIFLVDHIKAKGWVPPGGHIDKNEVPPETVKREMFEELEYKIKNEVVELFDISRIEISDRDGCTVHNDLWFIVHFDRNHPFTYGKDEFHAGRWFSFEEALKIMKTPEFREIIKKLQSTLS